VQVTAALLASPPACCGHLSAVAIRLPPLLISRYRPIATAACLLLAEWGGASAALLAGSACFCGRFRPDRTVPGLLGECRGSGGGFRSSPVVEVAAAATAADPMPAAPATTNAFSIRECVWGTCCRRSRRRGPAVGRLQAAWLGAAGRMWVSGSALRGRRRLVRRGRRRHWPRVCGAPHHQRVAFGGSVGWAAPTAAADVGVAPSFYSC